MKYGSKKRYCGIPGAGIFPAVFFLIFTCQGIAAADSATDTDAFQNCLLRVLETAPDGTTIDELRRQCQEEQLTDGENKDIDLLATRIYTDKANVFWPCSALQPL